MKYSTESLMQIDRISFQINGSFRKELFEVLSVVSVYSLRNLFSTVEIVLVQLYSK